MFDETRREEAGWRISANPLAWGNSCPEVVVLGFSTGPTQAGSLRSSLHNDIAYKGGRKNVGKILRHIGRVPTIDDAMLSAHVDSLIADPDGRFHFASLVRCTVERYDRKADDWKGTGGGMLDRFLASPLGGVVALKCTRNFLGVLPDRTRLVVMFGLGTKLNYVASALQVFRAARPGNWSKINPIAYTDGLITVVHVEHFAAQGNLIPPWLGETESSRCELGRYAQLATADALA